MTEYTTNRGDILERHILRRSRAIKTMERVADRLDAEINDRVGCIDSEYGLADLIPSYIMAVDFLERMMPAHLARIPEPYQAAADPEPGQVPTANTGTPTGWNGEIE